MENYEVVGEDTTDRTITNYLVDILVVDSTETSYKVRWTYRDMKVHFEDVDSLYSGLVNKLMSLSGGTVVEIQTDELGTFKEVSNWEEIRDYYLVAKDSMKVFFGNIPQVNDVVDGMFNTYTTKSAIESASIKDIHQFLNFHGAELKIGDPVYSTMKFPDGTGTALMDALVTIELTGIYPEDDDYSVYSIVEINPDQLKILAKKNVRIILPNAEEAEIEEAFEQIGELWSVIENYAVIHHWGWPRYTKEVRTSGSDKKSKVEIRIMEIV
ncbi:hypothetical protein [Algoriphagus litoralis]|uniref:hypothetical protein n=1 Tax=Algoriphagus litoralis TaxID=2202829 RepID=UPI000DB913E3|nr:hypothetical protein [Algoriphagus litoralis]